MKATEKTHKHNIKNIEALQEVNFVEEDGKKSLNVTIVKSGWSKNSNYWTKKAVKSIGERLLKRPKIFIDHVEEKDKRKTGRKLEDWAATVRSYDIVEEDNVTKCNAIIDMTEKGEWLYNEAKKDPTQVGLSVDAKCACVTGEAEGRKGRIVKEAVYMASTDFVTYQSAGGQVISIAAAEQEEELMNIQALIEALGKDEQFNSVKDLLQGIVDLPESEEGLTDVERKEAISKVIKTYKDGLVKETKTIKKEEKIIKEEVSSMDTLQDVKQNKEIYEALQKEFKDEEAKNGKQAEIVKENETLKKKVEDAEKVNKELKEAQDKAKAKAILQDRKTFIAKTVKDLKIPDKVLEAIQDTLEGMESDEKVKTFLESIKPQGGKIEDMKTDKDKKKANDSKENVSEASEEDEIESLQTL